MQTATPTNSARPALPAELTIYTVGELHPHFLAWVRGDVHTPTPGGRSELRLEASAVAEVDAAGVQLLLSLSRYLASRDECLVLADASPSLVQACEALGVADLISASVNEPGLGDKPLAGADHAH